MKKLQAISLLFLPIVALSSCGQSVQNDRLFFPYGDKRAENWISLEKEEWKELRESSGQYIVYAYVSGCGTCKDIVEPRLQNLINEYGIPVYRVNFSKLDASDPLKAGFSTGPTVALFKDGKKVKVVNYTKNEKIFANNVSFIEFIKKYVVLPKGFYLDTDGIKLLQSRKEDFYLIFTRSTCPDCSALHQKVLYPYLKENDVPSLYLIECDVEGIRFIDGEYSEENWNHFKEEWNLTSSSPFGYKTGFVPTIQHFSKGVLDSSAVYLNDQYDFTQYESIEEGTNVSVTITIQDSFYKDFIGKTHTFSLNYYKESYKSEVYTEYTSWANKDYHKAAIIHFLKNKM